jgi:bacterioferritin
MAAATTISVVWHRLRRALVDSHGGATVAGPATFYHRSRLRERGALMAKSHDETPGLDQNRAIDILNKIVELELAGTVRYTQYSLMVFGHARIPIINWMREQASESALHAVQAGEEVTSRGGNVSLGIGELVGSHHDSVDAMMQEMLIHERRGIELYRELLSVSEGVDVSLEELARQMIRTEQLDVAEIEKMLRKRGDA